MNLNTKINKSTALIVPLVLLALYTLALFVFPRTPIVITAYAVGILGALAFGAGSLYFIGAQSGYPWVAAIPMTLWRYVITSALLSGVFVIAENLILQVRISPLILIVGQVLVFAFYFVMLTLMHTGKAYIEEVDQRVAEKRQFIKELSADLESVKKGMPDGVEKDFQAVVDAVRYSDPMSHESLAALEGDIRDNVIRLGRQTAPEQIRGLCVTLVQQIKERNTRVRALK